VHHREILLLAVEFDLENLILQSVRALLGNVGDGSASAGGKSDQVVGDQTVLIDSTKSVASSDVIADLLIVISGNNERSMHAIGAL